VIWCIGLVLFLALAHVAGWSLTYPSEKYDCVSWDDEIPNIWKITKVPHHQPVYIYRGCEWNSDGVLVLILGFLGIKSARVFTICIHMFHCVVLNMVYLFTSAG
jgi:hypothetical protein